MTGKEASDLIRQSQCEPLLGRLQSVTEAARAIGQDILDDWVTASGAGRVALVLALEGCAKVVRTALSEGDLALLSICRSAYTLGAVSMEVPHDAE